MSFQSSGASNLVNSGICCTDGERYYYSDTNTRTLYQTQNGTADVIAEQFYGYYLNLSGNTIYYADAAADNSVTAPMICPPAAELFSATCMCRN